MSLFFLMESFTEETKDERKDLPSRNVDFMMGLGRIIDVGIDGVRQYNTYIINFKLKN